MRISSQPETKWSKKSSKMESRASAVAAMQARWEDDINQFVKLEETEEINGNDLKNNDTWMQVAKDQIRWKGMENIT